jgi:transposase-like protein
VHSRRLLEVRNLQEPKNDPSESARSDLSRAEIREIIELCVIRGKWHYLYRAVDKHGKTVDFLLRPDRSTAAVQAFFRKALTTRLPQWPRKIALDGYQPSHQALRLLRREDPKRKYFLVRSSQYPNNVIEQDHRAIKRRCAWMTGFSQVTRTALRSSGHFFTG